MSARAHPKPTPAAVPRRPELRVIASRPRAAQLHLFTFVVGNALFWTLWAAISVAADRWYWWPVIPFAGWALVLAVHLWRYRHPVLRSRAAALARLAPRSRGATALLRAGGDLGVGRGGGLNGG